MPILHIKDSEFDQVIKDNEVILIDFYANWCGPCKMIAPILEDLASEGHVIAKIDIDENPHTASKLGISSIPTLIVCRDGKIVKKHVGFAAKMQIEALLK